MRTPRNPTSVPIQRQRRIASPRISTAPTVWKSGWVKLSAVSSFSGSSGTALKNDSIENRLMNAASASLPGRRARKVPRPR